MSSRWHLPLLTTAALALAIGTAAWGRLYNETDCQYASAAKVMARGGSWLIPENNGIPRLIKPPLLYWAMAGSMRAFGVNEFAARLPGAVAIVALTVLTYLFGAHLGGSWRGVLAGSIFLTSLGTFTLGRIVMPEPLFSAFIAGGLYCAVRAQAEPKSRRAWFFGFWICAALASFVKGWHGLLYPLIIVLIAAKLSGAGWSTLRGLFNIPGILAFLCVNLPWYVFVELRFPGWLQNLLVAEQWGHIIGSDAPATASTNVPRWQFLLLHLAWLFPWSLAILAGWQRDLSWPRWKSPGFAEAVVASWMAVIFGSVLLTGQRQDYYAMSMWPALALVAASLLERGRWRRALAAVALTLALAFLAILATSAGRVAAPFQEPAVVAERATAWTSVQHLGSEGWAALRTTGLLSLGSACFLAAFGVARRWRPETTFLAMASAAASLGIGAIAGTSALSPYFSLAQAAPALSGSEGTRIVYDGGLDTGSSLLFYADLPVILLDQNPDEDFIVRRFGIGRDRFMTTRQFVPAWQQGAPFRLVAESRKLPEWQLTLRTPFGNLARCGTQVVLSNSR